MANTHQVATSFPDSTYSTSNKPSSTTLKSDIQNLEDSHNALDAEAVTLTGTEVLTNKTLTSPAITNKTSTGTDSGTETLANKTLTSPVINTGVSGTAILDEDNMASNSDTKLATQQSIKAYSDSATQTMTNKTLTSPVINTGTLSSPVINTAISGTAIDATTTLGTSNTKVPTQGAVKTYVDAFLKTNTSGLQVRYGTSVVTTDGSGNIAIGYNSAFPTQTLAVVAFNGDSATGNLLVSQYIGVGYPTASAFAVNVKTANTGANLASSSVRINYIAVGN